MNSVRPLPTKWGSECQPFPTLTLLKRCCWILRIVLSQLENQLLERLAMALQSFEAKQRVAQWKKPLIFEVLHMLQSYLGKARFWMEPPIENRKQRVGYKSWRIFSWFSPSPENFNPKADPSNMVKFSLLSLLLLASVSVASPVASPSPLPSPIIVERQATVPCFLCCREVVDTTLVALSRMFRWPGEQKSFWNGWKEREFYFQSTKFRG